MPCTPAQVHRQRIVGHYVLPVSLPVHVSGWLTPLFALGPDKSPLPTPFLSKPSQLASTPACCSVPVQVSRPCQAHSDLLGHRRQLLAAARGVEPCPPLPLLSTVQGSDSLAEMAQPAGRGGPPVCRRHAAPPRVVLQGQPPGAAGSAPAAHRQLRLLLPGGPLLHAGLPGCCCWPLSMVCAPQGPGQRELSACLPACLPAWLPKPLTLL